MQGSGESSVEGAVRHEGSSSSASREEEEERESSSDAGSAVDRVKRVRGLRLRYPVPAVHCVRHQTISSPSSSLVRNEGSKRDAPWSRPL